MRIARSLTAFAILWSIAMSTTSQAEDIRDKVSHHFADNNGVKIHYVSLGEGPLVVLVHGFPDFWYSWRFQMEPLAEKHRVVALDLRGYNESDKPAGQENYNITHLVEDVDAVIRDTGESKAVVMGHDWGGFIAWSYAMAKPETVNKLVICNLPHPKGMARELATNPVQQQNSGYARAFQMPNAHNVITEEMLATAPSAGDEETRKIYIEAFKKSNKESMLAYYKENYPKEPYEDTMNMEFPPVQCPVLVFHGLKDKALHANGLNNTWEWVNAPVQIVTIPNADHWVHHDAADLVNQRLLDWLEY